MMDRKINTFFSKDGFFDTKKFLINFNLKPSEFKYSETSLRATLDFLT